MNAAMMVKSWLVGSSPASRGGALLKVIVAPFSLMWHLLLARKVAATLAAAADPEKPTPPAEEIREAAQANRQLRAFAPTLHAPPQVKRIHIASGILWGMIIYLVLVHHAFDHIQSALTNGDSPRELAIYQGPATIPTTNDLADTIFAAAAIKEPDADTRKRLAEAIDATLVKGEHGEWRLPALSLALNLANNGQQCANRADDCKTRLLDSMGRLLIGYSPAWTKSDLAFIAVALNSSLYPGADSPAEPWMATRLREAVTFQRSDPVNPAQLAAILAGRTTPAGEDAAVPRLIEHALQAALDTDNARWAATYEVGFVFGPGRLAVLVLLMCILNALMYRQCARMPLEEQFWRVHTKLREVFEGWGDKSPDASARQEAARALCEYFDKNFPGLHGGDGDPDKTQTAESADPRLHPVAGLLSAAHKAFELKNPQLIQVAEDAARADMERWRETLNSFITLFPVIGFSATLLGLIAAFSAADQVAVFTGVDKAAAVRAMVGELSACFATTFLALLFMALLTIFSLRQSQREASLLSRLGGELSAGLAGTGK